LKIVKAAGDEDIGALGYASERLRNDKKLVMSSVKVWGQTLQFASEELRNDKQVVLAAIKARASAIYYASDSLKNDPVFIKAAKKIDDDVESYLT
jgi:CxxC motif-containing protein